MRRRAKAAVLIAAASVVPVSVVATTASADAGTAPTTRVVTPFGSMPKVATTAPAPASAAGTVVATGLNGPRQLSPGPALGTAYVAESDTGQITLVDLRTGNKTPIANAPGAQGVSLGPDDNLYYTMGTPPEDATGVPGATVVRRHPIGHVAARANTLAFELARNPDGQPQFKPNGKPYDSLSNPYSVLAVGPYALVADAGANDILKVHPDGHIDLVSVLPVISDGACVGAKNNGVANGGCDPVPTGITMGPDGYLYVSTLGAEAPGAGRVYKIDPKTGFIMRTWGDLDPMTGIAVDQNGAIYVSELLYGAPEGAPPPGFDPSQIGRLVRIAPDGTRSYAHVTMPAGLTFVGNSLYTTAWAIASFLGIPNAGQIVKVDRSSFTTGNGS
jgi:hypothetical protein